MSFVNDVSYYYVRNYLGDVTKVIDTSGNVVVEYTYDSWGKVLSTTGSLATTVGALNPIRYRGYYYDTETSLYYLQSRYYDPEVGRFISPDVVVEGGNLYTYCINDPVNRSDESGYLSTWSKRFQTIAISTLLVVAIVATTTLSGGTMLPIVVGMGVGAVTSFGVSAVSQHIINGKIDYDQLLIDTVVGATLGAVGGSSMSVWSVGLMSGIIGAGGSVANDWLHNREIDLHNAATTGAVSMLSGFTTGPGAQYGGAGLRKDALLTRKNIHKKHQSGQYRTNNNYSFGLNSNQNRINRLTTSLNYDSVIGILKGTKLSLEISIYQATAFS